MRMTPAQMAVHLICGVALLPFVPDSGSVSQRIRDGREMLRRITGEDCGYDLQAWHDLLKESRLGGYTYGRNIRLPKIMQRARESEDWQQAVKTVTDRENRRKAKRVKGG